MKFKNIINYNVINYHSLCASRFRDKTDRTSDTNLRASNTGNRLSNAVSVGSLNHDLMGIALSEKIKNKIIILNNFLEPAMFCHCIYLCGGKVKDPKAKRIQEFL